MKTFLPAIVVAAALLALNWYFLWEWWSHQLSGDVMIHLVFARNFAEGRWFEYSLGQPSRANTTILWEWILAVLGLATGQIRSNEGFMTVARIFAGLCVVATGWLQFRWGKQAGLRPGTAALVAVFVVLNPVVFYWTFVNPMETCMTLLLATATALWVWRTSQTTPENSRAEMRDGVIGSLWVFGLSLIRPEMLPVGMIAALAFLFGQGWSRWRLALMLTVVPIGLTILQALALALGGIPIVPTPNTARRLIALTYDTITILGIPINPDAWKVLLSWSPLLLAALAGAFLGDRTRRPVHFFALGVCGWSALFFSLYYYTTWQGRYMVPSLVVLVIPSVAAIITFLNPSPATRHASPIPSSVRFTLFPYALLLCTLALLPLARFAQAPYNRALVEEFVPPPEDAKVFLVQEVQSAYFYPHLLHISTEGLITPEVHGAYTKGLTLNEFIRELQPDLIAHGRYYLKDPEGLQTQINEALFSGLDLHIEGVKLRYRGWMQGAGPYFEAEYGGD